MVASITFRCFLNVAIINVSCILTSMNGRSLRTWLETRNVKNAELARMMGVSPATISRYLNEKTKDLGQPFLTVLKQVTDKYDADLRQILNGSEVQTDSQPRSKYATG